MFRFNTVYSGIAAHHYSAFDPLFPALVRSAFISQTDQSGIAQANRITFASVGRRDNSCRDCFVNDLSRAMRFLTRGVESFAHNPCRLIVKRAIAGLHEG